MPAFIPLRGFQTLGAQDVQNPHLLPLMDVAVNSGQGTLDVMNPYRYLTTYPRVDGTVTILVGGSITNLDTVKLNFASGTFSGGTYSTAAYTIVTADTTTTVAEQLVILIQNDATLSAHGIYGELTGTGTPAPASAIEA